MPACLIEFITDHLQIGTELILVHTDKPKQKVNRPRIVVGRHYHCLRRREKDGLYLRCPNGKTHVARWPRAGQFELTENGFAFYKNGVKYVEYQFVPEVFDDGFD